LSFDESGRDSDCCIPEGQRLSVKILLLMLLVFIVNPDVFTLVTQGMIEAMGLSGLGLGFILMKTLLLKRFLFVSER